MASNRREFFKRSGRLGAAGAIGAGLGPAAVMAAPDPSRGQDGPGPAAGRRNPIGVSTYSFWQFRGERLGIPECIDRAADMGFDGVEILLVQMRDDSNAALASLKRQAHRQGLCLMGLSTHQGFVNPDPDARAAEVAKTIGQVEVAYKLGIPTMRINTGRWGTSGSFDDLMANKGIEAPLEGHTDEEAFGWVIAAIEEVLPKAEECGVVLGLENHWGLGRTAEGVTRIVETIDSPWLAMTLDTGNFLEDGYDQMATMLASKIPVELVQAKTYQGGGRWYALDLDYSRIAKLLREHDYRGWISLEFEGNADAEQAVPESLAMLRRHFS